MSKAIHQFDSIDTDLLKKYSRPGPRYTSYPTAPVFSPDFTADDYLAEVRRTNAAGDAPPLSLYFHIPFCDTLCYFCGCNMMVTRDRKKINHYVQYVKREMDLMRPLIRDDREVVQIAWGGGTPTYLHPDEIRDLAGYTQKLFPFAEDIEAGVEIDPREMTRDHLVALKEGGFNRVSMGVQDFNPRVQQAVNRIQPEDMTREVLDWARDLGFESINLDLIYGLPFQTVETFEETLERIIDIDPDRIAVFNYAHVPWLKKHMALIKADDLPTPEEKLRITVRTIEMLNAAGYRYVGMDHFAKPDNELAVAQANRTLYRNFQGYTTHAGADLYGFGITSIGQFDRMYAQNLKTLPEYYEAMDAGRPATHVGYLLSDDDLLRRDVIMTLMCDFELDKRAIEKKWDIDFDNYFADAYERLQELVDDGIVTIDDDRIRTNSMGVLVIRNVAMAFDSYLPKQMEKPIFSKTV
ncbi:MAG: oxygen-independent coproporphyrinogen III oxidase [Bacteroidetes bacterium]|nr:oxygen-independent coproporphyrinogen III oxidase [Bacteroidota bacterium]